MILLHTSDWHLGMQFSGISLYEDQKYFIDGICELIASEHVDGVLLAGDIFDRSVASQEALELYDYAMTRICGELKVPVFAVAGNHDGAERLASCNELLKSGGLYIAGQLERNCMRATLGDSEIFLMPWLTTERAKFVFPEHAEDIHTLEDAYRFACTSVRSVFTDGMKHILVSHAFVTGASVSDSDRTVTVGTAAAVGADVFEGFDYVALGHIHGPQNIGAGIRYPGSPMIYSFGNEEHQTKGVTLLDTSDMSRRTVPLPYLHAHTTLKGTYDELMAADFEADIRNGFVRLELTDTYAGGGVTSMLRQRYPLFVEIGGISLDGGTHGSGMTLEELEHEEQNPETVFSRYIAENTGIEPDEHLMALFRNAADKWALSNEQ